MRKKKVRWKKKCKNQWCNEKFIPSNDNRVYCDRCSILMRKSNNYRKGFNQEKIEADLYEKDIEEY